MADKTLTDRLQPSLLDRLTDHAPDERTETRDDRVLDVAKLRQIIQRDLSWLLNTTNLQSDFDAKSYPCVSDSVLNFGLAEVTGEYSTSRKAELIRQSIERAITIHEPRIVAGSVEVDLVPDDSRGDMTVALDIRADMWAQPMPLELYLRSVVDVTTGEVSVERRI